MTALAILSFLFGLLVLAAGWLLLKRPDLAWRYTRWTNRSSGLAGGERTPEWERANRFNGLFCVVSGPLILAGTLFACIQLASPTAPVEAFDELVLVCRADGLEVTHRGSRTRRIELEGFQASPKGLQALRPEWEGRPVLTAPAMEGVVPLTASSKTTFPLGPGETQRVQLTFPKAQCKSLFPSAHAPLDPNRGCEALEFRHRVVDEQTGAAVFDVWRRCDLAAP